MATSYAEWSCQVFSGNTVFKNIKFALFCVTFINKYDICRLKSLSEYLTVARCI